MAATLLTLKIGNFNKGETVEEFPKETKGKRCKVDIASVNDTLKELKGKVESIVLTLLKDDGGDKKFSLSIKLNRDAIINTSSLDKSTYGENIYIYKNIEDSITKLYNVVTGDVKYTHILIIGTATDESAQFTFTANKSIFVINATESQPVLQNSGGTFNESLNIEEFLNLRYIDYFSFDNEKFNELYKGNSQGGGGISKIKNKSK
jgi:hypothetical protein